MQSFDRAAILFALFCLALTSGVYAGRVLTQRTTEMWQTPDERPPVPTVRIDGIRNGLLHGDITGVARVFIGNEYYAEPGIFAMDAAALLVNEVTVSVPSDAKFVASTRGKKYYPVFSSAGERISIGNRIYFSSASQAEAAGYQH